MKKGYITFTLFNPTGPSPKPVVEVLSLHIDFKPPFVGLQDNQEEERKKDIHVENSLDSPDSLSTFSYTPNLDEQDDHDEMTFVGDDEGI